MLQVALRLAAEFLLPEVAVSGLVAKSAFRKLVSQRAAVKASARSVGGPSSMPSLSKLKLPNTDTVLNTARGAGKTVRPVSEYPVPVPKLPPPLPGTRTAPSPGPKPPPLPSRDEILPGVNPPGTPGPVQEKEMDKPVKPEPKIGPEPNPRPSEAKLPSALERGSVLDRLNTVVNMSQGLAAKYLPTMTWTGAVKATGYKTTPGRTVVHYCLALAFGLIPQTKIAGTGLHVEFDYDTNTCYVSYTSNSSILTEALNIQLLGVTGQLVSPEALGQMAAGFEQLSGATARGAWAAIKNASATAGIVEVVRENVQGASNMIQAAFKAYQNVGLAIGPQAMWTDIGAETVFGGRASALLAAPITPEPYAQMWRQPMLTRLAAANPQPPSPPEARAGDAASGYSVDLRSLVIQALYDPTVLPPKPDTNVSLPPVYSLKMEAGK